MSVVNCCRDVSELGRRKKRRGKSNVRLSQFGGFRLSGVSLLSNSECDSDADIDLLTF